jgi:hypothetical protein
MNLLRMVSPRLRERQIRRGTLSPCTLVGLQRMQSRECPSSQRRMLAESTVRRGRLV